MQSSKWLAAKELSMTKIKLGDKVIRNAATRYQGDVRLGDNAPAFRIGDKVVRDAKTHDQGNVRLGDNAPAYRA